MESFDVSDMAPKDFVDEQELNEFIHQEIFGQEISPNEFEKIFTFKIDKNREFVAKAEFQKWELDTPVLLVEFKIDLYVQKNRVCQTRKAIMHFKPGEVFVWKRVLKTAGAGLISQVHLEAFCRKYGIKVIKNLSSTRPEDKFYDEPEMIGAYVWGKYGYEFDNNSSREDLRKFFEQYCQDDYYQPAQSPDELKHPWNFCELKGYKILDGENGLETLAEEADPLGKIILTDTDETIEWDGKKELNAAPMPGDRVFINYLRQRNRADLARILEGFFEK